MGHVGSGGGWGFFTDLGVAFHGSPEVDLQVRGPLAGDPDLQADLAREEQEIQDDVENVRVYPVLSLGFTLSVR